MSTALKCSPTSTRNSSPCLGVLRDPVSDERALSNAVSSPVVEVPCSASTPASGRDEVDVSPESVSRQRRTNDAGDVSKNSSMDVADESKGRAFKKRRRKRARTASERQNWDEGPVPGGVSSPSREEKLDNASESDSSGGEEGVKSSKNGSDSFKSPEGVAKTSKRRRCKKKVILRPAEPGAPNNSTQFIIDSHENSGLYYDFSSPSPATQRFVWEQHVTETDENRRVILFRYRCDYVRHMQESFESEYSSARAVEFEKMTRDELVAKVVQLEQRENELSKVIDSFSPAAIERELNETLIAAQEENRVLRAKKAELEANPLLMDYDMIPSPAGSATSDSSSSSSSSDASSSGPSEESAGD